MRISFEEMAISIANIVKERSEDPHKKVGACILNKEGRVLSIGYNGLLSKQKTIKKFWQDRDERRKYVIHAETNALACISRYDEPYILACSLLPCSNCAINICSHGIKHVFYSEEYNKDIEAYQIFDFYKVKLKKINFKNYDISI
jgi:dCMP deaminase